MAGPDNGCSTRSRRLLQPPLSYIDRFIRAMVEGTWWVPGAAWASLGRRARQRGSGRAMIGPRARCGALQRPAPLPADPAGRLYRTWGRRRIGALAAACRRLPPPPCRRRPPTAARVPACAGRDPKANPDGWIPLVVAENKLSTGPMLERLNAEAAAAPPLTLGYSGCGGCSGWRLAACGGGSVWRSCVAADVAAAELAGWLRL